MAIASAIASATPSSEREERLHLVPGIAVARPVEHAHAERQVVRGEGPGAQHDEVLGADAVPVGRDRAGIGELAHLDIGAAVAQHLDAFGTGRGMAGAVHHQVRAVAADDLAHGRDARLGRRDFLDVDSGFGAEPAGQREARLLRRADHDHPPGAHLLRRRHREHPDRPRALDDHRVAPFEAADPLARENARMQEVSGSESAPRRSGMSSGSL